MIHQIIADFPMIFPLLVRFFVPFFPSVSIFTLDFPMISPLKGNTNCSSCSHVFPHVQSCRTCCCHLTMNSPSSNHLQTRPAWLRGLEEVAPSWTWLTSSRAHDELFLFEVHRWNCENQQVNSMVYSVS